MLEYLPEVSSQFEIKLYKQLQEKFLPWICLRELDLAATVSLRGYDVIRQIEFHTEDNKKYKRGLFQSRYQIARLARELEMHGKTILPFVLTTNSVEFNIPVAVKWLMEKHGLWDYVLHGDIVTMAATVDGGALAWKLSHVSAGIKFCDERTINPLSGELLFGPTGFDKVQSRNVCYPLHVHIAKDNKEFYTTKLAPFFSQLNDFEDAYGGGLKFGHPQDMFSHQKCLGQGGAMKNVTYACHLCSIHRDDLNTPNEVACDDCIRQGAQTPCFHQTVSDEQFIDSMRDQKEQMLAEKPHLALLPLRNSKVRCGNGGLNDNCTDPYHIEFEGRSVQSREIHRKLLENEFRMRNIVPDGTRSPELKIQLMEILLIENTYSILCKVLASKSLEEAMVKLEKAIPCLLHLENRSSEAIINRLIHRGWELREDSPDAIKQFILSVEAIINEQFFGSPECKSTWKFPVEDDGTMGDFKFANWRARRIVLYYDSLVDICLPGEERAEERDSWSSVASLYRDCITVRKCFIFVDISTLTYLIC
jgi:hypothetical protein